MGQGAPMMHRPFFIVAAFVASTLGERVEMLDVTTFQSERVEIFEDTTFDSNLTRQLHHGEKVAMAGTPLLPFPDTLCNLVSCKISPPEHLGAGTFGESWLVVPKDANATLQNRREVMKLLYIKKQRYVDKEVYFPHQRRSRKVPQLVEEPQYLKYSECKRGSENAMKIEEAKEECNIASLLHNGTKKPESRKGAGRVMGCYGNNIGKSPDMPMYLMLEDCGDKDLDKFMGARVEARSFNLSLIGSLFKQLLEALAYFASFQPAWIHHDLKPANIVIKEHKGNGSLPPYHTLHVIDFGATTQGHGKDACVITPSTPVFAPPEWYGYGGSCVRGTQNFDSVYPAAFDLFSAGAIYLQMLTGRYLDQLIPAVMKGQFLNHDIVQKWISPQPDLEDPWPFRMLKPYILDFNPPLVKEMQSSNDANTFLKRVMMMLSKSPRDRPSAAELLAHPFMRGMISPDDPQGRARSEIEPNLTLPDPDSVPLFKRPEPSISCVQVLQGKGCEACLPVGNESKYHRCLMRKSMGEALMDDQNGYCVNISNPIGLFSNYDYSYLCGVYR